MGLLDEYLNGVDPNKILGWLVCYSINGVSIKPDDLKRHFIELGLDMDFFPAPVKPQPAFEKATGKEYGKRSYPLNHDQSVELTIEHVTTTDDKVQRHIVRKLRDSSKVKLQYEPLIGTATFFRPAPRDPRNRCSHGLAVGACAICPGATFSTKFTVQWNKLSEQEKPIVKEFIENAEENYRTFATHLDSMAVRAVVRDYIKSLNAVQLAGGGTYFVIKDYASTLERLSQLVDRLASNSTFQLVPLIESEPQRQRIADQFEAQIIEEAERLTAHFGKLMAEAAGSPLPIKKFTEAGKLYRDMQARAEEYARKLRIGMSEAAAALEVAQHALADLSGKVAA